MQASSLVVMGVAGCGKSSVGHAVAQALGWSLIEGDDFHSPANRDKMSRGVALTDEDRADWLSALGQQIGGSDTPVVLTCSALKRAYRDGLRQANPKVLFLFLKLDRASAAQRVASRGEHFFSPALVDSQFAALEEPDAEAGVLTVDATASLARITQEAVRWLEQNDSQVNSAPEKT
ncbi:gluconokinase [Variovorax dokdonensis]|uniref:Gluconokinase n=1 Tax=Variovorax dokdonensis TaxID=344883 RepID=A0ABT7N8P5_9BURK|nr:gluconokinase [Variovorax dokdonensis]MDM0044304.1 gluconokinase [Variovorax dokdonensis]